MKPYLKEKTMFQQFMLRARGRIFSGLILIVPIVVTIFVARLLFDFMEGIVGPLIDRMYGTPWWRQSIGHRVEPIPGIKVIFTVLFSLALLYLAGFVTTTFLTRKIYVTGERLVLKIPLIKSIYGLTKQIIDLVTGTEKNAFKQIALFEYPHPGSYSLGFITGETRLNNDPRLLVNILLPTTPIPSQLFLLLIPADRVQIVEIGIEEGLRLIMSGGVVAPDHLGVHPYVARHDEMVSNLTA